MEIKRLVEQLCFTYDTRDPFELCRSFGIFTLRSPLIDIRGFYQREAGVSIIHIAEGLSEWEDRFVCAHELGHCFLHPGLNRVFLDIGTLTETSRLETDADEFACRLLFGVPPELSGFELSYRQISECLNIPEDRVRERIERLLK